MRKVNAARPAGGTKPPRPSALRGIPPPSARGAAARPRSNKGLLIGLACGGVLVLGALVAAVVVNNKKGHGKEEVKVPPKPALEEVASAPAEPAAEGGFEKGAKLRVGRGAPEFELDTARDKTFRDKVLAGRHDELITPQDAIENLKAAFTHLVGDDETLARASWGFIVAFYTDPRLASQRLQAPKLPEEHFNKASWRAALYKEWAVWPSKQSNAAVTAQMLSGKTEPAPAAAAEAPRGAPAQVKNVTDDEWMRWMDILKTGAREGEHGKMREMVIQKILAWGRPGIKRLIDQVGGEDPGLSIGSTMALNDIVRALPKERGGDEKFVTDIPRAPTREAIKEQWLEWFKKDYKDPASSSPPPPSKGP
jgi:hypothetical protein